MMKSEYPKLLEDYDLESLEEELDQWHAFFFNEFFYEGRFLSYELDGLDTAERTKFRDRLVAEAVKQLIPRLVEKHAKEGDDQ